MTINGLVPFEIYTNAGQPSAETTLNGEGNPDSNEKKGKWEIF